MRSTGEVMGVDTTFGLAFAKSQMAAGTRLPDSGTVFLSLADRDKPAGLEVARSFSRLGFSVAATLGTAGYLRSHGLTVDTLVAKVGEEGVASDAVELIAEGKVQLVVNTPRGLGPRADGQHIRQAAGDLPRALPHHAGCRAGRRGRWPTPVDTHSRCARSRTCTSFSTSALRRGEGVGGARHPGRSGPVLPNPVMTASGTSGHGTELSVYGDLAQLGAVVVKSLSVDPLAGQPRTASMTRGLGMLNSVGA